MDLEFASEEKGSFFSTFCHLFRFFFDLVDFFRDFLMLSSNLLLSFLSPNFS